MGRALRLATLGVPVGGLPTFEDDFARGDGAVGNGWSAGTISSGALVIAPTTGNNLLADPGLENWNSATDLVSWAENKAGGSTVNRDGTEQRSGTYCARLDIDASGNYAQIAQTIAPTANVWHRQVAHVKGTAGKRAAIAWAGMGILPITLTTNYIEAVLSAPSDGTGSAVAYGRHSPSDANSSIYYDDLGAYKLTTASMISYREYAVNAFVQFDITRACVGTPLGVAHWYDENNHVLALAGFARSGNFGEQLWLMKCVGGIYTTVATASFAYSAGLPLALYRQPGGQYSVYYNGVELISPQTISDAVFSTCKNWGAFSTHEGNTFDNALFSPKA